MSKLPEYQTFVAVVEEQSLTAAARKLHRSTSAISKQLAKLEDDLGVQLVDRTTQSFVVTHLGRDFYHKAKRILQELDEAERSVRDSLNEPRGKIAVSLPELLLHSPLIDYAGEFAARYPGVKLDLAVTNEIEDLLQNQLDFAFRVADVEDTRLCIHPLTTVNLIAVAAPAWLAKHTAPTTVAEAIASKNVMVPRHLNVQRMVGVLAPELAGQPVIFDEYHTSNSGEATLVMAKAGMGIAFMADLACRKAIEAGELVPIFPKPVMTKHINLIYRKRTHSPRLVELFKSFILEKYEAPLRLVS